MNLKQSFSVIALASVLTFSMVSCKSKISDGDLKAKVETAVSATPGVTVDVKEGVVTLNGVVTTEAEKIALETAAKATDAKGVKSVVNNITVQTAAPIVVNTNDADLVAKVLTIAKDFPQIQTAVKDGIITVTGSVEKSRIPVLKQALDALSPKKVDLSAITVK